MSSSTTEYIHRKGHDNVALVQVTFDHGDGEIEEVRLYDEFSDQWLPVAADYQLPAMLESKIKSFIADWMQVHSEEIA